MGNNNTCPQASNRRGNQNRSSEMRFLSLEANFLSSVGVAPEVVTALVALMGGDSISSGTVCEVAGALEGIEEGGTGVALGSPPSLWNSREDNNDAMDAAESENRLGLR
jgi:hypothetical protein